MTVPHVRTLCPGLLAVAALVSGTAVIAGTQGAQSGPFKVLISADMEGVSGVAVSRQTGAEGPDYDALREIMTGEVNAAIAAAFDAGASEVVVVDAHGSGTNIRPRDLDRRAQLVSGFPMPMGMMTGIDETFGAVMFIGYHASAGAPSAILGHTYTNALYNVRLNGQEVGEWGLNAAVAGYFGVPVVFASGDQALIDQLAGVLPGTETVAVKEGLGRTAARCLHPDVAREQIAAGVKKALARRREIPPWRLVQPVTLEMDLASAAMADVAALVPGMKRVGGRTISYTAPDMAAAYRVSVLLDHVTSR